MRGQSYSNKKNNSNKEDFQGGETKVMKKSLKMLLVFALVFSMLAPALAFAEEAEMDTQAKFDAMVEAGILEGIDGEAALDKNMQRNEVAKILANIFELEVVAGAPTPFPDEPADNWGYTDGYIQAVVAAGLMEGGEKADGTIGFRPNAQLSLQELAVVLNRALDLPAGDEVEGKTSSWATDAVAAVVAAGLLPASDDFTVEATRGDLVSSTFEVYVAYVASQVPEVAAIESFTATGAKKLAIEFNKVVNDDDFEFTVKRGNVTLSGDVEWNEAGTVATFENATRLATADYTVTVKVDEDTELTATASVEASKATSIEILGDKLFMVKPAVLVADVLQATVGYKVMNQYDENVTTTTESAGLQFNASKGTATSASNSTSITVTVSTANKFAAEQLVVLSLVHPATGLTASKALTVSASAAVSDFTFNDIDFPADTDTIFVTGENGTKKFYFDFAAADQYGNALTSKSVLEDGVQIFSSNTNVASHAWDVNESGAATLEIVPGSQAGTAIFTAVSLSTGKTTQFNVMITAKRQPVSITLELPATDVVKNEDVKIPYVMYDQVGNPVTSFDTINPVLNLSISGINTIGTQRNPSTGDLEIIASIAAGSTDTVVVTGVLQVSVAGATQLSSSVTLNAQAQKAITAVRGLKTTAPSVHFVKAASSEPTVTLTNSDLLLHDQYGRAIALDTDHRLAVSKTGSSVTLAGTSVTGSVYHVTTLNDVVLTGTNTAGSDSLTITLQKWNAIGGVWEDTDSSTRVTTSTIAKSDIVDYNVAEVGKIYAASNTPDYTKALDIHGLTSNGTKVNLRSAAGLDYTVTATTNLQVVNNNSVSSDLSYVTGNDVERGVTVTFEGATGAVIKTQTVTLSLAAPAAQTIEAENSAEIAVGSIQNHNLQTGTTGTGTLDKVMFEIVDQYGAKVLNPTSYIVTNKKLATGADVTINNVTGVITVTGILEVGNTFVVTAVTENGKTATVTIVAGN